MVNLHSNPKTYFLSPVNLKLSHKMQFPQVSLGTAMLQPTSLYKSTSVNP